MTSIMRPLVIRFPIMAGVILYAAQLTIHAGMAITVMEVTTENRGIEGDDLKVLPTKADTSDAQAAERVNELLTSSEGFLAGEDTPVWLAYRSNDTESVSYRKLRQGIVKEAMDFWKFGDLDAAEIVHPGIESDIKPLYDSEDFVTKIVADDVTERPDPDSEVLYASILVTMDYAIDWPTSEMAKEKLIMGRILYALAFWNGVDLQLRHLQNPKVRLRVAGIVIGYNRQATPYLRDSSGLFGLSVESSLPKMLKYWRNLGGTNKEFSPQSFYNAVAAMTDASLSPGFIYTVAGIATSGPPCVSSGTFVAGIVISDDNAFTGIQKAVHETGHLLGESGHDGDTTDCPEVTGYVHAQTANNYGRTWSECSLKHISTRLRQSGWLCMSKPKEYYPPGKPIEIILPGKLMPASKLCQGRGWKDGIVCWEYSTCDKLYCANNHSLSSCRNAGPMPDGTTCANGKMCLDGLCISNTTLAFV